MRIVREFPARRVEHAEAGFFGAAPDAIIAVDEQRADDVAAERVGVLRIVAVDAKTDAVVAGQPVVRADPQVAVAVLQGLVDAARRQPGGDAKGLEIRRCIQWCIAGGRGGGQGRGKRYVDQHRPHPPCVAPMMPETRRVRTAMHGASAIIGKPTGSDDPCRTQTARCA
jgi:hypothetical protein